MHPAHTQPVPPADFVRVRRATGLRSRVRLLGRAIALVLLGTLVLPACASGGYRYRFEPLPAVMGVHTATGTFDLALVSVLGAITPGDGSRDEMHLRVRLQNATQQPLRLPPARQHLLSSDLLEYGPARLVAGATEAAPGQSVLADLAFPFPDDETPDLRGLTLNWVLEVDGKEIGSALVFQRVTPDAWRPYGPPGWPGWGPYGAPPGSPYWRYPYGWYGP